MAAQSAAKNRSFSNTEGIAVSGGTLQIQSDFRPSAIESLRRQGLEQLNDIINCFQIKVILSLKLLVETGTVSGSGGKLSPTDVTTRAEVAQVLYNLLMKA